MGKRSMSNKNENKINELLERLGRLDHMKPQEKVPGLPLGINTKSNGTVLRNRPHQLAQTDNIIMKRRPGLELHFSPRRADTSETDNKLKEIMKISGKLKIGDLTYQTEIREMEHVEVLGNGTCGSVVKMRHKPSGHVIAVKQMRRSGNSEENKRIIMDIEVVLKSLDCDYIVKCLGCFITESEVWICMELMSTCFDKLLKRLKKSIPEAVLGKVTVATVEALSYLKDKHGVIHRDVKPSNILIDSRGNIKLCDFGISGRLVDSLAKTRNAGCAAYMAPERIEPDPDNPDYDVRADVWSLGITLVELATGQFPYTNCETDFEMLTLVVYQDPPTLPEDKEFSDEFRDFVKRCLIKEKRDRPKYNELKNHTFIKRYETEAVDVGKWFVSAIDQADNVAKQPPPPRQNTPSLVKRFFTSHLKAQPDPPPPQFPAAGVTNGTYAPLKKLDVVDGPSTPESFRKQPSPPVGVARHQSRLSTFQSSNGYQREPPQSACSQQQRPVNTFPPSYQSAFDPPLRTYSPYHACQCHLSGRSTDSKEQKLCDVELRRLHSPIPQRRPDVPAGAVTSPYQPRRTPTPCENHWRSPSASPLPLRSQFQTDEQQQHQHRHYHPGNTSPIILQRFYHQQKQHKAAKEAEEFGKKRFSSYIKMQLSGDRSGRSSRHQSPEPPPRLSRVSSVDRDSQSPLALRRNFLEANSNLSPGLSRRYVSPSPPVPPPRKLSESSSVPGSPQNFRTRYHYTPEPQRRPFQNNDVS